CEDGKCRAPSVDDEPAVWLPPIGAGNVTYPIVARALARDATVRRLMARYDVTPRDEVDDILDTVIAYYREPDLRDEITGPENVEHVRRFLDAVANGGPRTELLLQRIREAPVVLAVNAGTGEEKYQQPQDVYVRSEELEAWFAGSPRGWFLHEQYSSLADRMHLLGVNAELVIRRRPPNAQGYVVVVRHHGVHKRGTEGFDPDCAVDEMKYAFEHPTVERARFIWNTLLPQLARSIRGTVESSTRETYSNARREEQYSPFGKLVSQSKWLPNRDGQFFRPDELKADDLPDGFLWHEQAAHAVGMRGSTVSQVADELGVDPEFVRFMKSDAARAAYEEYQKEQAAASKRSARDNSVGDRAAALNLDFGAELAKALVREGKGEAYKPQAHLDPMPNPARRGAAIDEQIAEARSHEPPATERFQRVSRRQWDAKDNATRTFIEQEYVGECQVCQDWFTKRDGKLYFEAHYLVSNKQAAWIDRPGNVLCLCAQCGAKFQHGAVDFGDFVMQVADWRPTSTTGAVEFEIQLCGNPVSLRFSSKHLLDVQALMRAGTSAAEEQEGASTSAGAASL
ncbi:MAG: hypothetical protein KDC46_07340, partial [Thermoleophilia bacterium]|nr:hypothetical protein [Thermoleophilia bacterium]